VNYGLAHTSVRAVGFIPAYLPARQTSLLGTSTAPLDSRAPFPGQEGKVSLHLGGHSKQPAFSHLDTSKNPVPEITKEFAMGPL
jgi:hypothetical protein